MIFSAAYEQASHNGELVHAVEAGSLRVKTSRSSARY
jgi:hypothetical protein